jgi:tRNA-dihydrouridine synthase
VDVRLAACERVPNPLLGTVDFTHTLTGDLVLRTSPALEKGKLVCQLGSAHPATALAAARVVEADVAAVRMWRDCPLDPFRSPHLMF